MTLSEQLRAALVEKLASGVTKYRISKDTGINWACLRRFAAGTNNMRNGQMDRLADYLELHLAPIQMAINVTTEEQRGGVVEVKVKKKGVRT